MEGCRRLPDLSAQMRSASEAGGNLNAKVSTASQPNRRGESPAKTPAILAASGDRKREKECPELLHHAPIAHPEKRLRSKTMDLTRQNRTRHQAVLKFLYYQITTGLRNPTEYHPHLRQPAPPPRGQSRRWCRARGPPSASRRQHRQHRRSTSEPLSWPSRGPPGSSPPRLRISSQQSTGPPIGRPSRTPGWSGSGVRIRAASLASPPPPPGKETGLPWYSSSVFGDRIWRVF